MLQLIITVGSQFVYIKCVHTQIHIYNFSKLTEVLLKITWEFPAERQLTLKQQGFEPQQVHLYRYFSTVILRSTVG